MFGLKTEPRFLYTKEKDDDFYPKSLIFQGKALALRLLARSVSEKMINCTCLK